MKIFIFFTAAYILAFGGHAIAQNDVRVIASPHAFTPEASELGKYGKMPVGHFTGTPEISIPLTELRAKGFTVPVSLSYHASGNKPDAHPGWTGLGWSLHAGGRITRTTNGLDDERTRYDEPLNETNGIGYMSNIVATQGSSWTSNDLNSIMAPLEVKDYSPDEFQVSIDEIQASFYLYSNNTIKIVSKGSRTFTADVTTNTNTINLMVVRGLPPNQQGNGGKSLKAPVYSFIERIDLTADDGTKYTFGGDTTAIEFSIVQHSSYGYNIYNIYTNLNEWNTYARATSWMLTRIEKPNGETVEFKYVHDGIPIIKNDVHHYEMYSLGNINEDTRNPNGNDKFPNVGLSFILPCYLTEITSTIGQDKLTFQRTKTSELRYQYSEGEMLWVLGEHSTKIGLIGPEAFLQSLNDRDYYMQLDRIEGHREVVDFSYSADITKRLTLLSVDIHSPEQNSERKYQFEYNQTALPVYNSKQTDNWGYYNGKYYGATAYNQLYAYRTPDTEKAQAGILTKVIYPTGGATSFEYELHTYSKIADQLQFQLTPSSGVAGGLRVKKISDIIGVDTVSTRTFIYEDALGVSTGILSGIPAYSVSGTQYDAWDSGWNGANYIHAGSFLANYILSSEVSMNPLSVTNGSHVTYSMVKEVYSDGGYTVYHYTNHDTADCRDEAAIRYIDNVNSQVLYNGFSSKELFRGLLLEQSEYKAGGQMVRRIANVYNLADTDYLYSVEEQSYLGTIKRAALTKIFTGYPALASQTVTSYADGGYISSQVMEQRTYSGRLLTLSQKTFSGADTVETRIKYSGQLSYGVYYSMRAKGMTAYPIEVLTLRNGSVIEGTLTEWQYNTLNYSFVPWKEYKLELTEPISVAGFTPYNGITADARYGTPEIEYTCVDSLNNVTQFVGRDSIPVSVIWGYGGLYPIAKVTGRTNSQLMAIYGAKTLYPTFLPGAIEDSIRAAGEKIDSWRWDIYRGMTRHKDMSGRKASYVYDGSGRLILSTDEKGRALTSAYYNYQNL